eukprot:m.148906 g.148906  ORF g.148906 m.148906 type:complete len:52 (+) comp15063_c4_seq4:736-891(+)
MCWNIGLLTLLNGGFVRWCGVRGWVCATVCMLQQQDMHGSIFYFQEGVVVI